MWLDGVQQAKKNEKNGQIFAGHRLQNKNRNETDIENYRHVEIVGKKNKFTTFHEHTEQKKSTRVTVVHRALLHNWQTCIKKQQQRISICIYLRINSLQKHRSALLLASFIWTRFFSLSFLNFFFDYRNSYEIKNCSFIFGGYSNMQCERKNEWTSKTNLGKKF